MVSKQLQLFTIAIITWMLESVKACTKYQIFLDQQCVDRRKKKKVDYQLEIIDLVDAEFIVKTSRKKTLDKELMDFANVTEKENICTATCSS